MGSTVAKAFCVDCGVGHFVVVLIDSGAIFCDFVVVVVVVMFDLGMMRRIVCIYRSLRLHSIVAEQIMLLVAECIENGVMFAGTT